MTAVRVLIVDLSDAAWPDALPDSILAADERARAARFRFDIHRNRFLRRRVAYRLALADACGCAPAALVLDAAPNGKPFVAAPDAGLRFNASHAGDLALLAMARGMPLGVDIEEIRPGIVEPALVARVLTPGERVDFATLPPDVAASTFFTAWARKEAVVKATGEGLSVEPDTLEVAPTRPKAPPVHRPDGARWWLADLDIGARHRAALATPRPDVEISMSRWTIR